jgi:hypothetical protein
MVFHGVHQMPKSQSFKSIVSFFLSDQEFILKASGELCRISGIVCKLGTFKEDQTKPDQL